MPHKDEIRDYWNLRANGFSDAVEEELQGESGARWTSVFRSELPKTGMEILDLGTGAGFFPVLLSRLGHRVTAIDDSDAMLARTKARLETLGMKARVLKMDAQKLTFADATFDAVVSRNVLWNLDDPGAAYGEIARVLRPGGKLILEDGNMYLYHHDSAYAEIHRRHMEEIRRQAAPDGGLHAKHNADHVDFSIIEKIAEDLPMSYQRRPQWDFERLLALGFDEIHVSVQGGELPMGFLIVAGKKASHC